jgi:hypothetical protein
MDFRHRKEQQLLPPLIDPQGEALDISGYHGRKSNASRYNFLTGHEKKEEVRKEGSEEGRDDDRYGLIDFGKILGTIRIRISRDKAQWEGIFVEREFCERITRNPRFLSSSDIAAAVDHRT